MALISHPKFALCSYIMLPCNIFCYYAVLSWLCRDDCFISALEVPSSIDLVPELSILGDPNHNRVIDMRGPAVILSKSGTKDGINAYVDKIMTYHNYPDLIGYQRYGNGYVSGDKSYITLSSITDEFGRGAIYIRFPPRRNPLKKNDKAKLGDLDGLYFSCNYKQWDGYWVWIFPLRSNVEFPPEPREDVYKLIYVPKHRSLDGYYLDYTAAPNTVVTFAVDREVSWVGAWKPCDNFAPDSGEHTDL